MLVDMLINIAVGLHIVNMYGRAGQNGTGPGRTRQERTRKNATDSTGRTDRADGVGRGDWRDWSV